MYNIYQILFGFFLGVGASIFILFIVNLKKGKRLSTKSTKPQPKEFTQYMIVSDNAIMWVVVLGYMFLAAYAIYRGFEGALPWLAGTPAAAFGAWSVTQSFLIKKSEKQNTQGGITYDTAMKSLENSQPTQNDLPTGETEDLRG